MLLKGRASTVSPPGCSHGQRAARYCLARLLGGFELASDAKIVRWPDRYMDKRDEVMWDTVTRLLDFGMDYARGSQAA